MKTTTILLAVLLALISVGAFAQPQTEYPDDGGGEGGVYHWTDGCFIGCGGNNFNAYCISGGPKDPAGQSSGYSSCTEYQGWMTMINGVPYWTGSYCTFSGYCHYSAANGHGSTLSEERQAALILDFMRDQKILSDGAILDFIAKTDYALRGLPYRDATQQRLKAYRAEFNRLVANGDPRRELKPGFIPIAPHRPTKTPAATVAAR